jgi:hypothetical protein
VPIDDALEQLEVPNVMEHLNPLIPKTVEELAEKYKHKFKIKKDQELEWLIITVLGNIYKDIYGEGEYTLIYDLELNGKESLFDVTRACHLSAGNDYYNYTSWQSMEKSDYEFADYTVGKNKIDKSNLSDKIKLEKWFDKTEKFILKSIPELEAFVKNYKLESHY